MFLAVMFLCLVGGEGECVEVADTRGPYATVEQCRERLVELAVQTPQAETAVLLWRENNRVAPIVGHLMCKLAPAA
jgi:hypothetical protein